MATISQNTYRIVSVTHSSTTITQPVGGSIVERCEWLDNRPDIVVAPGATALNLYDLTASVRYEGLVTPGSIGTKATLTFTLEQFSGATTATVAVLNMLLGASHYDFDSQPHTETTEFKYTGSTLSPITVTLV